MKQWNAFLKTPTKKQNFASFVVRQLMGHLIPRLGNKILYVTSGSKCDKLAKELAEEVLELESTQEEADTQMLLHAAHITSFNYDAIVMHGEIPM